MNEKETNTVVEVEETEHEGTFAWNEEEGTFTEELEVSKYESNKEIVKVAAIGAGAAVTLIGLTLKGIRNHKRKKEAATEESEAPEQRTFKSKLGETKLALKSIWGKTTASTDEPEIKVEEPESAETESE